MNQLTTIAALPGSGGGCAASLKAEPVPKGRAKPDISEAEIRAGEYTVESLSMIVSGYVDRRTKAQIAAALKEPAPRSQYSKPCPVKFEDPKEAGPTPADMAAHPVWGGPFTVHKFSDWKQHFQGEPVIPVEAQKQVEMVMSFEEASVFIPKAREFQIQLGWSITPGLQFVTITVQGDSVDRLKRMQEGGL